MDSDTKKNTKTITGNTEINEETYSKGEHPNSLANLKPFPKGISGNPLGRPTKYESLKQSLNKLGEEETEDYWNKSQGTRKNQVLETIWKQAIKGEIKYVQLLAWLGCLDK